MMNSIGHCYNKNWCQIMEKNNINRFQDLIASVRKSLAAGDRSGIRLYADALIAEFPKSEEGWIILASVSEPEEALTALENALRINPDSQAACQGIHLVSRQIFKENKSAEEIPEKPVLDETQPLIILEQKYFGVPLEDESDVETISDSNELAQEHNDRELNKVDKNEDFLKIESKPENQASGMIMEELSEAKADFPTDNEDAVMDSDLDNNEQSSLLDKTSTDNKFRFKRKSVETLDNLEAESKNKPFRKTKIDPNPHRKIYNVDVVELLILSGGAILLPLLVFLYFYFGK
jgi:hypothetical protein